MCPFSYCKGHQDSMNPDILGFSNKLLNTKYSLYGKSSAQSL